MRKTTAKLVELFRAKDNLIFVNTYEENEFIREVCGAISALSKDGTNFKVPKNVYVYSKEYSGEDFSDCHSNTFLWTDGKEYPEIGKYDWLTLDEIKEKGGIKAYYGIFSQFKKKIKWKTQ